MQRRVRKTVLLYINGVESGNANQIIAITLFDVSYSRIGKCLLNAYLTKNNQR